MNDPSHEEDLLSALREDLGPTPSERAALASRLSATLGVPLPSSGRSATQPVSGAPAVKAALASKAWIALGTVVLLGTAGAAFQATKARGPAQENSRVSTEAAKPTPVEVPRVTEGAPEGVSAAGGPPGAVPPVQFGGPPGAVPPVQFGGPPGAVPPVQFGGPPGAVPPAPTVALDSTNAPKVGALPAPQENPEERELVEQAQHALRSGNPSQALSLVAAHSKKYPAGRHAEEREALAVRALVAAGRKGEAEIRGERFLRNYPASLFAGSVRRATGQ